MIKYENKCIGIGIDEKRGEIAALRVGNKEVILPQNRTALFNIKLRAKDGTSILRDAHAAGKIGCEYDGSSCRLHFSGFDTDIEAVVTVALGERLLWRIEVKNNTPYAVEWVDFLQITVPDDLVGQGGKSRILW